MAASRGPQMTPGWAYRRGKLKVAGTLSQSPLGFRPKSRIHSGSYGHAFALLWDICCHSFIGELYIDGANLALGAPEGQRPASEHDGLQAHEEPCHRDVQGGLCLGVGTSQKVAAGRVMSEVGRGTRTMTAPPWSHAGPSLGA